MTINQITQTLVIAAIAVVGFTDLAYSKDLPSAKGNVRGDSIQMSNQIIQSLDTINNASQRFFRQGQIQLEEEITDLQQGKNQLDESILSVDSEVIDDSEEIQRYD